MLEVTNLSLHYAQHLALEKVHLSLNQGETVVVLGANGAGKSSMLNVLAGRIAPDKGTEVSFLGSRLVGRKPHEFPEMGIALVPEGRGIFGDLTVAENLSLGAYVKHARAGEAERLGMVYELFPRLAERRSQIARTMSGGEQQMIAIGRALMSQPKLLMLDEPSLGLAPVLVLELFNALEKIKRTGVSLLLVEQNVKVSLNIADRGYLLEGGRVVGVNTAEALKQDPAVQQAFLGLPGAKSILPANDF
ncbi:ABC transporter ATP-binding protein [Cucumibacter marinus]|uniref:ABC transporter ATP-binding protein n=1 Tax=Cucumibacter marinus TaxID=1121252 RepID=UPI0004103E3A|nr:ABC transporter ATP-binding protein [Cucumibacter marinus]